MWFNVIFSVAGPASPSGLGGALLEARGDTEGGAGGEGEPGEGEGAGEAGASGLRPRAGDTDRKTEEDRATAAGRGAGGPGAWEAQHGAQRCPRWSQAQGESSKSLSWNVVIIVVVVGDSGGVVKVLEMNLSQHEVRRECILELCTHRWSSKELSWRRPSRGTCCCRRRTTCSKRNFTARRGTDTHMETFWTPFHALQPADVCVVCLTRRMEDVTAENETLSQALSSKEASVQRVQQQLEEKSHECSVLSRQLQQTLDDTQKEVCDPKCSLSWPFL